MIDPTAMTSPDDPVNPVADQEALVKALRQKLREDHPEASPEQLEIAIGNALKVAGPSSPPEVVEAMTRHHLGEAQAG